MNNVYIYDANNRLELWGLLSVLDKDEKPVPVTIWDNVHFDYEDYEDVITTKVTATGNTDITWTLNINKTYPIGHVLAEFISLDEVKFAEIAKGLPNTISRHGLKPFESSLLEPIYETLFYNNDAIEHKIFTKYDLLSIAHKIAIFRKYVDLCNSDPDMRNIELFVAFRQAGVMDDYPQDYCSVYLDTEHEVASGIYSWKRSVDAIDVTGHSIDYFSEDPHLVAESLLDVMLNQINTRTNYMKGAVSALAYTDPFEYMVESLKMLVWHNKLPKKCKNCGLYFIPLKRTDAIYCDRISPQNPNATCKVQGARLQWHTTLQSDEAAKLYRTIYSAKQIASKRYPAHMEDFERFKVESKQWKSDVKQGKKTEDEYLTWLTTVKEKRV